MTNGLAIIKMQLRVIETESKSRGVMRCCIRAYKDLQQRHSLSAQKLKSKP